MQRLVAAYPAEPLYCDRLATVQMVLANPDAAVATYRSLLAAHPEFIDSRYNLARLLKRIGRREEALEEYQACLGAGISGAQEVHSNIGVILSELHRHEAAEQSLQAALALQADYAPALYNLALLQEEKGDWAQARGIFQRLLEADPGHVDAMVRLAFGETCSDPVNPLVRKMTRALKRDSTDALGRENLAYALGKVHDDCGKYEDAFNWYEQANRLSHHRVGPYDRRAQEAQVDQLIDSCDAAWLAGIEPVSDASPLFICGMFRSGSTLLEQILATHPGLLAGGEIEFFPRRIGALAGNYPANLTTLTGQEQQDLGKAYLDYLEKSFGGLAVSNKRPDNFLYLGLIGALFPNARIVHTRREPLDNALSVYFQPLESALNYANGLEDIGHYYHQYQRLMDHWRSILGDAVCEVSYEQLVASPEPVIRGVLDFIGLDWDEDCLRFYEVDNRVRTASVSQVRQPLYQSSVNRWQNYADQLESLRNAMQ